MIELLEYFKKFQPKGDVYLIPKCNPIGKDAFIGVVHQDRFDSSTGDNFNRYCFYIKSIIQLLLKSILIQLQHNISKLLKIYYNNTLDKELANEWELPKAKRLNLLMQKKLKRWIMF